MLEIVRFNEDEYNFPCLVVLGCFDGLHRGHAELLKKAKLQSKINGLDFGVMMFEKGKDGEADELYTFDERLKLLESYKVKFVLKVDYTDSFKRIKPLEFLSILEDKLNVKAYMSGKDFRFGQGAKGKSSTLKAYAEDEDNGVWYMPIKDVVEGDEKISSSQIKSLLDEGNVKKAAALLGRNYSVSGTVVHGAERGKNVLDVPTINLKYPADKHKIKEGVYVAKCVVDGKVYYGVANYGAKPTFNDLNSSLEVHLDGASGDMYDKPVTVEFIDFLREIVKFNNENELKAQLNNDISAAKKAQAADAESAANN